MSRWLSLFFIFVICIYCCLFFFFFFQAEDGIRDVAVTGVQTCALPISLHSILLGFRSMEAVSDFVYNSPHLFRRYVFDVLRAHEFSMTISWKPRDQIGRASCRERV